MNGLRSVPIPNQAVTHLGARRFAVPLQQPGWVRWVRPLFPISKERKVELDKLGAEVLAWCDGHRTVEEIIDLHKDRWQLSFFESRGMILQFLQQLEQRKLIVIASPEGE